MHTSQKWVLRYILVIAVAFMLGAASHRAEAQSRHPVQACLDNVNRAPAASYCADLVYIWISTLSEGTIYGKKVGVCVASGDCSITANVGTVSTTWTVSANNLDGVPDDMEDMDICFKLNAAQTAYTATLTLGCSTGEETASTATTDGLPDPTTSPPSGS